MLKEINQLKNKSTTDIRVSLLKYVKQEIVSGLEVLKEINQLKNKATTDIRVSLKICETRNSQWFSHNFQQVI